MAEEKKSIEISYKANLKDLVAKLKTIPNITDQEAKKMVSALDRQLKQAEKAAKKSAEASKKAAKEAANAARRGADDFDELADSARRAEEKLERVGEASGDIDRGFSSIGLALRGVNPQLAEAADGIADAFAVTEGLTMSFAALNPVVIAAGAALGALTLGFVAYQSEIEKSRELTTKLKEAQQALLDTQRAQEDNLVDTGSKLRDIQRDYKLLTGQISQYEFNLEKAGEAAEVSFLNNIKFAKDAVAETESLSATVATLINTFNKPVSRALSDSEKERLRTIQLQHKQINNNLDLLSTEQSVLIELFELQKILKNEEAERRKVLKGVELAQQEAIKLSKEMVTLEKELADANEDTSTAAKKIVDVRGDEKNELHDLIEMDLERFTKQQEAAIELAKIGEQVLLSDDQQNELAFARKIERIRKLGEVTGQEAEAQRIINALIAEEQLKQIDSISQKREQDFKRQMDMARSMVANFKSLNDSALDFMSTRTKTIDMETKHNEDEDEHIKARRLQEEALMAKRQKSINVFFRMSQLAAVGEIAMEAATQIMAATALPPGLRGIRIGVITAAAATQSGVVMAQQPPQASFHMGGMAPDEMPARVLRGEAVLDRATVRRIGGEEGVRQLSQGTTTNQVVVIQPFKHFGRFTREIGFRQPRQSGIRAY